VQYSDASEIILHSDFADVADWAIPAHALGRGRVHIARSGSGSDPQSNRQSLCQPCPEGVTGW